MNEGSGSLIKENKMFFEDLCPIFQSYSFGLLSLNLAVKDYDDA